MGSALSTLFGGAAVEGSSSGSTSESRVSKFHSTERWQLHFNEIKGSSKLMVVDFAASWCGPCKFMEPAVEDMAAKYTEVDFVKLDVDELPDIAKEFAIQAMPTFVLVKGGKEVDRVVGAKKNELEKKINKHRA